MARCPCVTSAATGCQCSINDTSDTSISGSGSTANPFEISVRLNPAATNLITSSISGLSVSAAIGLLDYADVDVTQTGIEPSGAIAGLSVTATFETGRWYEVRYFTPGISSDNPGEVWAFEIREGISVVASRFAYIGETNEVIGGAVGGGVTSYLLEASSDAAHTFAAYIARSTGSGTAEHIASTNAKAYIAVFDYGAG